MAASRQVRMAARPRRRVGRFAVALAVILPSAVAEAETPLERGRYLVEGIAACGSCHAQLAPVEGGRSPALSGGAEFTNAAYRAYAQNITPDGETGIGGWTVDEIVRALREGKRPDGSTIGPPMAFDLYRRISDTDARAIAVYLKSLPPVRNRVPRSRYDEPLPASYGPPLGAVPDVPRDEPARYGEYLAGPLGRCIECHTPIRHGRPDYDHRLGAGGSAFVGAWGETIASNITPDRDTGLGAFTDEQIMAMIVAGVRPNRSRVRPPMAHGYFATLRREDLDAIVAYLRSLKPIKHFIDK